MAEMNDVSAVVLSYNRRDAIGKVLDVLQGSPVDEIVVYDGGSTDGSREMLRTRSDENLRVIEGENLGAAGRNIAVRHARNELIVMLDDDSYPLPGAIERLRAALERDAMLAVAAGLVRDIDAEGNVVRKNELGTFDWFFRAGRREIPETGAPVFFFPEGACMIRKTPYLEVGGFFPGYFIATSEVDLTTRLVAAGYDVRYLPTAEFDHMKAEEGRLGTPVVLRYRVRNQIWYFYRHFPWWLVVIRVPLYLLFDLVICTYGGAFGRWTEGVKAAWTERGAVSGTRRPLSRSTLRRAEMNRGRVHVRLLLGQLGRRLRRRPSSARGR